MDGDQFERYEVTYVPEGLHIVAWQVLPRVGGGVIALVMLAAGFVTDPYPGHNRIWAGLGVATLALVALFGVRVERWTIGDGIVRFKSSLWDKEISANRSLETPLVLWIELLPRDSEGDRPPDPHVVHLVGPGGATLGDPFRFRQRSTVDRFLETLRTALLVDVQDRPADMV